jgi:zinc transporter 9
MTLFSLLVLGVVMFVGSFLIGLLPLSLSLSSRKQKFLSAYGIGLLIGTALIVIIPEGIHTYQMDHSTICSHDDHLDNSLSHEEFTPQQDFTTPDSSLSDPPTHSSSHSHSDSSLSPIGLALGSGFIFMLLVDRFSSSDSKSKARDSNEQSENERLVRYKQPEEIELESQNNHNSISASSLSAPQSFVESSSRALIGILVHSAVDGIALGAISLTDNSALELVVFLAIILHKAPAAFGLVSFLIAQGHPNRNIRFNLALFSAAAPIAAVVTFAFFASSGSSSPITRSTLGLLLLFSGGTFLFTIALHILPELNGLNDREEGKSANSHAGHSHASSNNPPSWRYVTAVIAGIASPTVLALAPHQH